MLSTVSRLSQPGWGLRTSQRTRWVAIPPEKERTMSVQGVNSVQGLWSAYGMLQPFLGSSRTAGGSAAAPNSAPAASPGDLFRSDIQALFSAIQSGDMTLAQTALQTQRPAARIELPAVSGGGPLSPRPAQCPR